MKGSQSVTIPGVERTDDISPLFLMASHELKAPLALVRQLSLSLSDTALTDTQRQEISRRITLTSERALRLTTDLTRTARLEDGFFAVEPLNPLQILEEAASELLPLYEARGRRLEVVPHRRPLLMVANRDLVRRVVLNFADNALHYSSPETPVRMQLSSHDGGRRIRLSVRDYGPAIATPMWRVLKRRTSDDTISLANRPGSSGLGIMIARQFAEAMNADIGVIRHRDGASFYIDIGASTQLSLL